MAANDKERMFRRIYGEQYKSIYGYVYKHILNREESEDLTQEIFAAAYKHLENYDETKGTVATWLYVITNNKLKNHYRDKKSFFDIDEFCESLSDGKGNVAYQAIYLKQCRDILAKALKQLPERSRRIVVMAYFEEMKSKEIALELGMSAGNVRINLMRSLQKMQDILEGENWNGKEL